MPQGSVLGPVLFLIYVNDIDEGLLNKIWKFADDTKVLGKASTVKDRDSLMAYLDKLYSWTEKWLMKFNVDKCKVMHFGRKNIKGKYSLGGKELIVVREERDLGIIVTEDFKVSKQCSVAAKKGYQILGMVARTFISRKMAVLLPLYKSLVRPHLDYCI